MFCYENEMVFTIYVSDKNFEDSIDLLFLINDNKSHYVCIKNFNTFMFHKKKWFCKSCLQCFSSENVLIKHKEDGNVLMKKLEIIVTLLVNSEEQHIGVVT